MIKSLQLSKLGFSEKMMGVNQQGHCNRRNTEQVDDLNLKNIPEFISEMANSFVKNIFISLALSHVRINRKRSKKANKSHNSIVTRNVFRHLFFPRFPLASLFSNKSLSSSIVVGKGSWILFDVLFFKH